MINQKQRVLVVDDEPINLQVIKEILQDTYILAFANNGNQAIEVAQKLRPDLILLDIMMPDLNGYETCKQLKSNPKTEKIPVIFVTTLDEEGDETLGFTVGGLDYIAKPLCPAILRARIGAHLELKKLRDDLINQNSVLKENDRLRDDIDNILRHDLKGPLMGMLNYPRFVLKGGQLIDKHRVFLKKTIALAYKMLDMINLSLDLYKMEKGIYQFMPVPVDIIPIVRDIIEENNAYIEKKKLKVNIFLEKELINESNVFTFSGEELLTYSMLSNLMKNAVEASPLNQEINIMLEEKDRLNLRFHNQGVIPREIRNRFFEKYTTAKKDEGTGLGTYSAKLIAEIQNGTIDFETSDIDGTEIILSFPKK